MNKKDFESLDRMINFIRSDLRHCIGVDANWVVSLASFFIHRDIWTPYAKHAQREKLSMLQ